MPVGVAKGGLKLIAATTMRNKCLELEKKKKIISNHGYVSIKNCKA
jgi:hypothetical protein